MPVPVFVSSSNIDAIGYCLGTLYIRFHHGGSYAYDKVPFEVFNGMKDAESAGKYFHANVKSKFEFRKLESDPFVKEAA